MNTEAAFRLAQMADQFQTRAERERQIASALRIVGKSDAARIAQARSEVWDEAAVHCREAGRGGKIEPIVA